MGGNGKEYGFGTCTYPICYWKLMHRVTWPFNVQRSTFNPRQIYSYFYAEVEPVSDQWQLVLKMIQLSHDSDSTLLATLSTT